MPKSLIQECSNLFTAATYQFRVIWHFCHIWCVLHMCMSSTCVLSYVMPSLQRCLSCIFVINVVTRTSMQTRLRDIAGFRDLGFSQFFCLLLFWCHVNLMLQWYPCLFWDTSVRCFEHMVMLYPSMSPFAIMGALACFCSCSMFAIKCSWQNVNMLINFAMVVVGYPSILWACSFHG